MRRFLGLPAILLFLFRFAHAGVIEFGPQDVVANFLDGNDRVIGWQFTANEDFSIGRLGVYDANADGLGQTHEVGIFDASSHTLLSSVVIPQGTAGSLSGLFRYASINPLAVTSGNTYVIAASWLGNGDGWVWWPLVAGTNVTNRTIDPRITVSSHAVYSCCSSSSLAWPNSVIDDSRPAFVGPNFEITGDAQVPEPSTFSLSVAVLFAFGHVIRTRLRTFAATHAQA